MALRSSSCSVRNLCRSSSAENSSSASGFTLPSRARARSAARSRFSCSLAVVRARRARPPRALCGPVVRLGIDGGTSWSGPYSATSVVLVDAELLEGALQLLDAQPLLGRGPSRRGGRSRSARRARAASSRRRGPARPAAPARGRRGPPRPRRALGGRGGIETSSRASATRRHRDPTAWPTRPLADQPLAALGSPRRGPRARRRGLDQRVGAAGEGPRPLLAGPHREPGLHLGLAGDACDSASALALGGVGLGRRRPRCASLGRGQARPRARRARPGPARAPLGAVAIAVAMPVGLGRAARAVAP